MQASTSGLRPRQRTFTSCTECRRRKQRCNQGKPCGNCNRRYPPVLCTYHETSSPPQTFDRVVDLRDNLVAQPVLGPSAGSHPSYMQTSQYDTRAFPATTSSSYTVPSSSYNTSPISRPEYSTYQNENSIATSRSQYSTSVSSAGSYGAADAGYYPSSNQMDYSSAGSQSGYYPTTDYYSTNGDPAVFVGATSGEYYYVEPDPDEVPSTRT